MLGSGIFVLPGLAAAHAGPLVALSYILAAALVLPAALSKLELATAMPVSGGTFIYVDRAFGPWAGTVAGLGTWLALCAKTAFALAGLGAYLAICTSVPAMPFTLAVLAGLLLLNARGAGKAAALQTVVVGLIVGALLLFAGVGVGAVDTANYAPAMPFGVHGILAGAGFVFVAYNGVTKVCSVAGEVRNPERTLPLAMLSALGVVTVLYAVIALLITGLVPWETLGADVTPMASAAAVAGGPTAKVVMSAVAVTGLISMSNAGLMAASRFPVAMAEEGLLPEALSTLAASGAPTASLLLTGAVLLLLVTCMPVVKLAKLASGFTIFTFSVINGVVVLLRQAAPHWYAPTFRSPLYPLPQYIGVVGGLAILWSLGHVAMLGVVGGVAVGSAWYQLYGRARVSRTGELQRVVEDVRAVFG